MKKWLLIFTFALLAFLSVSTECEAKYVVKNAKAGPNATWSLTDKGVMRIKGKGKVVLRTAKFNEYQENIKKIYIAEGITELGEYAFDYTQQAKIIRLPNSLEKIGGFCFSDCQSLESIKLPSKIKEIPYRAFENCTSLKKVTFPKGVTKIEAWAFHKCSSLETLVIPDSVRKIEKEAIYDCQSLKTVVLPKNLKKLGKNNLKKCLSLRKIKNRSKLTIKLDEVSGHRTWKVSGKKVKKVKAHRTAKSRGTKFKITYDLRGGKAKGTLPTYYYYGEKFELPQVTKDGVEFICWVCLDKWEYGEDFYCYYGKDLPLTAYFIQLEVENIEGGKVKVQLDDFNFCWNLQWAKEDEFGIYYWFCLYDEETKEWKKGTILHQGWERVIEGLEVGKEYRCAIAYDYMTEDIIQDPRWLLSKTIRITKISHIGPESLQRKL